MGSLRNLGFLTIGLFDGADPGAGHETTLEVIELGERLGFDSAWVRHRHLQFGISSPVAVLAAASQRTSRIHLGTAVIPLGWENPLRLAEDLATVDVLSEGFEVFSDRVQPHSPGLGSRLWYGGGSLSSARWAGENGMNFLTSSVVKAEQSEDFAEIQLSHIREFRAHHPDGDKARVSQGHVALPFAFEPADYTQILTDIAAHLGPALGWQPAQ
ncbi:LLM class flavin-dependent oxidoreductase [Actinokineospora cianjurensis]|uniref:Luciferase-like monooxygenase n=1 Tax=Actinokineospora cianjurensis TaxID=585224 RepID=A0A421B3E6_9PSEU|nr:LLM class flavin-dependent oxidoreductase [Actinokineospora cianjurensis]RLK58901.1 luciferase-like monooxygenase [Actinokineospora cianjurensis]